MSSNEQKKGLNILCIDGGGVRGLSSVCVLGHIMEMLGSLEPFGIPRNPNEYFDVIAGSGTGGLFACLLGRLDLAPIFASIYYATVMGGVFTGLKTFGTGDPGAYSGVRLKDALKTMVLEATKNSETHMLEEHSGKKSCKTMLFAPSKQGPNGPPTVFRSYKPASGPNTDCPIWEALYHTMAHPALFPDLEHSDLLMKQSSIRGESGPENPIAHVLAEVKALYPDRHVSCIVSIGAGHVRTIQLPDPGEEPSSWLFRTEAVAAMKKLATDNDNVAEQMAAQIPDHLGVYYRFNSDEGLQVPDFWHWENGHDVAEHAKSYMARAEMDRKKEQVVQALRDRRAVVDVMSIGGYPRPQSSSQSSPPSSQDLAGVLKACPLPTSLFTGREADIRHVEGCLVGGNERRVCIIHGLGGAGKTQLALKTIERNRNRWTEILHVDASSSDSVESALQEFAIAKNIGETYKETIKWLESRHEPWLVVFDNADRMSINIQNYFPGGNHGNILITTRLSDLTLHASGPNSVCHISSMAHDDALSLLLGITRMHGREIPHGEMEVARMLLQEFGNIALSIVHAGAYLGNSPHVNLWKYRELFLSQRQSILEQFQRRQTSVDDYSKAIFTTGKMCYDLLVANGDSQRMFWLLPFLHHGAIHEQIFQQASINIHSHNTALLPAQTESAARDYMRDYLGRFSNNGYWDTARFSRAIGELVSCSLIDFDPANNAYNVHPLVLEWARTVISQPPDLALECATTLLSQSVDWDSTVGSHIFRRGLVLHVNKVVLEQRGSISANHASSLAEVYGSMGRWNQKEALDVRVKQANEQALGHDHPNTLASVNNLVSTYLRQGRWDEAESLQAPAVNSQKRTLGHEHLITLKGISNLASAYSHQGRWGEAEQLQAHVLNACKRVLGEEHPDTLNNMKNLAITFMSTGRWGEAEVLLVQAIRSWDQRIGAQHPDALQAKRQLEAARSRRMIVQGPPRRASNPMGVVRPPPSTNSSTRPGPGFPQPIHSRTASYGSYVPYA